MASRHWQTALQVAAAINGHTFSVSFAATVEASPKWSLAELSSLRVVVVPVGPATSVRDDRQVSEREFPVNVVVWQQCRRTDAARIAALFGLLEELQNFLEDTRLPEGFGSPVEGTETEHDPTLLNDPGVFLGVVSASYRAWRKPD